MQPPRVQYVVDVLGVAERDENAALRVLNRATSCPSMWLTQPFLGTEPDRHRVAGHLESVQRDRRPPTFARWLGYLGL